MGCRFACEGGMGGEESAWCCAVKGVGCGVAWEGEMHEADAATEDLEVASGEPRQELRLTLHAVPEDLRENPKKVLASIRSHLLRSSPHLAAHPKMLLIRKIGVLLANSIPPSEKWNTWTKTIPRVWNTEFESISLPGNSTKGNATVYVNFALKGASTEVAAVREAIRVGVSTKGTFVEMSRRIPQEQLASEEGEGEEEVGILPYAVAFSVAAVAAAMTVVAVAKHFQRQQARQGSHQTEDEETGLCSAVIV